MLAKNKEKTNPRKRKKKVFGEVPHELRPAGKRKKGTGSVEVREKGKRPSEGEGRSSTV